MIDTNIKFFGQRVYLESTGDKKVDMALKRVFHDDYRRTAPLDMERADVKIILEWSKQ